MRVNVYAEELPDEGSIEIIGKEINGHTFTGLRIPLYLPVTLPDGTQARGKFMHHPDDDDSSAITIWGKRDLRVLLREALARLDDHYDEPGVPTMPVPLNPDNPKQEPLITTLMKQACMGEYSWEEQADYHDENGNLIEHTATREVPWDLCKKIYKQMATMANGSAEMEQTPEPITQPGGGTMTAKEFNEKYPVGSGFIYQPLAALRGGELVETRSVAWELAHGEPVVKITGRTGGVAISHLTAA